MQRIKQTNVQQGRTRLQTRHRTRLRYTWMLVYRAHRILEGSSVLSKRCCLPPFFRHTLSRYTDINVPFAK